MVFYLRKRKQVSQKEIVIPENLSKYRPKTDRVPRAVRPVR